MNKAAASKTAKPSGGRPATTLRWWLVGLVTLGVAAIAVNAYRWLAPSPLETIPPFAGENLEPRVRGSIASALAEVEHDQSSAVAWGKLGKVLRAHDLAPQANACFRNAQRLDARDYHWPYYLGVSLATSDADAALDCFQRASSLAGNRPHVHLRLAELLLDRGQLADAEPVIDRVLADRPSDARAQLAKARCLLLRDKIDDSRMWAEKSAAGAPDKRSPHLLLAQLCRRLNDSAGLERAMQAVDSIPDEITAWDDPDVAAMLELRQDRDARLRSADEMSRGGMTAEAIEILSGLVEESDASARAGLSLVDALMAEHKYAQAERVLREYDKQRPDDERICFRLGVVAFQQGDFQNAASEFRRAIELKPDHVTAHYNLGHALQKCNDAQGAKEAFLAAVRIRPSHGLAQANLAELYLEAGNADEARRHLTLAARLIPDDPKVKSLSRQLEPAEP